MPASFANIEHECETPGAKNSMEQRSYFEPISETSEARASGVQSTVALKSETKVSDEIWDAVE